MNLNQMAKEIYENNVAKGFWGTHRSVGEVLALIHSEVSEALEEWRDHRMEPEWTYKRTSKSDLSGCSIDINPDLDGKNYIVSMASGNRVELTHEVYLKLGYEAKPTGFPSELADIIIRVLDLSARLDIDIEKAIQLKHAYNLTRPRLHGRTR